MRKWLKDLRTATGITQAKVAEAAGICESAYSMIESGKRDCAVDTAKKIAAVIGFDWTRFYEDEEEDKHNDNQAKP